MKAFADGDEGIKGIILEPSGMVFGKFEPQRWRTRGEFKTLVSF